MLVSISHGTGHRQNYIFSDPVQFCGVQKDYACSADPYKPTPTSRPLQATSCQTCSKKERLEESRARHCRRDYHKSLE